MAVTLVRPRGCGSGALRGEDIEGQRNAEAASIL